MWCVLWMVRSLLTLNRNPHGLSCSIMAATFATRWGIAPGPWPLQSGGPSCHGGIGMLRLSVGRVPPQVLTYCARCIVAPMQWARSALLPSTSDVAVARTRTHMRVRCVIVRES